MLTDAQQQARTPRELPGLTVTVSREELRLFAAATLNLDPVYSDVGAARAAGLPDLPLPPTYLFSLELRRPDPYGVLGDIGIDRTQMVHGEESFTYRVPCYAGDTLRFSPRFTEDYTKKGGELRFLVRECLVERDGHEVATLRNVIAIRRAVPA